jgi:hypothetical protein
MFGTWQKEPGAMGYPDYYRARIPALELMLIALPPFGDYPEEWRVQLKYVVPDVPGDEQIIATTTIKKEEEALAAFLSKCQKWASPLLLEAFAKSLQGAPVDIGPSAMP